MELQEDGVTIYRGRVTKDTKDFNNSREIETEGLLACLNDSVIAPFAFPDDFITVSGYQSAASGGNVVEYFLSWLLSQHNAQVTAAQQIHLGTVTVSDANNYIVRSSSEYASTWTTITSKLSGSSLGGYLLVRYEDDGTYLDYYADLPLTNTQTVEFGENLLDLLSKVDASSLYTVILPIGKDGITISSLPDGAIDTDLVKSGETIYSTSGVAAYGKITHVEKFDGVEENTNLRTKAAAMLAANGLASTITVKACDLHGLDAGVSFRVGRKTLLTSTPHNFSAQYPLMELDIDIMDPGQTEITLGKTLVSQTDYNKNQQTADTQRMEQLRADVAQQQATEIAGVVQELSEQITSATQTSQSIMMAALENYTKTGDFETYKSTVSTMFEQTASQIQLTFQQVSQQITDVGNDVQQKYNERTQYIRFVNGDIVLGEEGNEITLKIENDRIGFLSSGSEVAYFSNRKLYVTDGEYINSLKLGKFAFVPRANGNLAFKKVVN